MKEEKRERRREGGQREKEGERERERERGREEEKETDRWLTLLLLAVGVLELDDVFALLASGDSPAASLGAGLFLGILFIPATLGKES